MSCAPRREELTADPPGAVVVWGGERIFAAGAEISEFGGPEEAATIGGKFRAALDAVAAIPRATIAAVNGYALGGGCELALACDLRVAADNAKFGQPEILLGIIPGGGGTKRLARLVGPAHAKDMIFSGRQVAAEEALRIGLADRVVPAAEVFDTARAWAASLAQRRGASRRRSPRAAIDRGLDSDSPPGSRSSSRCSSRCSPPRTQKPAWRAFSPTAPVRRIRRSLSAG